MQKLLAALAFVALLSAIQVHAFAVAFYGIAIYKDFENGGIPEIYILCDPHTSFERSYALPEVVKTHTPYLFEEPKIILDDFLGTFEKHECVIIEADVFDSYVDPDAEDQTNDVLGSFTFERTDFENGISYKVRDGYVEVALICGNC